MEKLTIKRLESLYEQLIEVQDINVFSYHYSEFDEAAQVFLYEVLRNTSWEIDIIEDLIEYDLLSDKFIEICHQEISFHWGVLNEMSRESLTSERLKTLGCDAKLDIDFNSFGNVSVTNKKINEILTIGRSNEECKKDKKFKKLVQILQIPLFYRYYSGFCHTFDENSSDEYYECYNLGDCYVSEEFVSFYQLDYAQVVGLLYADILAEDLQKSI